MRLRDLLRSRFANWPRNYAAAWDPVLGGVSPAAAAVPASLTVSSQVPLLPRPHDFAASLQPNEFHTMRCLDRVRPAEVRVAVVGQDPYPRVRQATGRAFEQGDFASWGGSLAYGLKHIVQRLAQHRSGQAKYVQGDAAWSRVVADAASLQLPSVRALYDDWEDAGVVFLNYVPTYTLPAHVFTGHAPFWRPVATAILRHLATRPSKRIVFALFGTRPGAFFDGAGILAAASAAGTQGRCRVLRFKHPSARPSSFGAKAPFLRGANPFDLINDRLRDLGEAEVAW